jgi:hypothetical protein
LCVRSLGRRRSCSSRSLHKAEPVPWEPANAYSRGYPFRI